MLIIETAELGRNLITAAVGPVTDVEETRNYRALASAKIVAPRRKTTSLATAATIAITVETAIIIIIAIAGAGAGTGSTAVAAFSRAPTSCCRLAPPSSFCCGIEGSMRKRRKFLTGSSCFFVLACTGTCCCRARCEARSARGCLCCSTFSVLAGFLGGKPR